MKTLSHRYIPQVELELTEPEVNNLIEGSKAHYDARCRHQSMAGGLLYGLKSIRRFFDTKELDLLAKIAENPLVHCHLHTSLITALNDLLAETISKTAARADFELLHQEFDVSVHAPMDLGLCVVQGCVSQGEFAVFVKNDRGELKISRDSVCPEHVLQTFLEACSTDLSPSLEEMIESARHHVMTDEEKEAQRQSWVRGERAIDAAEKAGKGHTSMFPPKSMNVSEAGDLEQDFDSATQEIELGPSEPIPTIVCLCGSTKFYEAFQKANYEETMAGRIVLSVGFFMHSPQAAHGQDFKCSPEQKIQLDELHKRKIDLADEVLVLNLNKYIGDSTRSEIEYALAHGKKVRYLEDLKA